MSFKLIEFIKKESKTNLIYIYSIIGYPQNSEKLSREEFKMDS